MTIKFKAPGGVEVELMYNADLYKVFNDSPCSWVASIYEEYPHAALKIGDYPFILYLDLELYDIKLLHCTWRRDDARKVVKFLRGLGIKTSYWAELRRELYGSDWCEERCEKASIVLYAKEEMEMYEGPAKVCRALGEKVNICKLAALSLDDKLDELTLLAICGGDVNKCGRVAKLLMRSDFSLISQYCQKACEFLKRVVRECKKHVGKYSEKACALAEKAYRECEVMPLIGKSLLSKFVCRHIEGKYDSYSSYYSSFWYRVNQCRDCERYYYEIYVSLNFQLLNRIPHWLRNALLKFADIAVLDFMNVVKNPHRVMEFSENFIHALVDPGRRVYYFAIMAAKIEQFPLILAPHVANWRPRGLWLAGNEHLSDEQKRTDSEGRTQWVNAPIGPTGDELFRELGLRPGYYYAIPFESVEGIGLGGWLPPALPYWDDVIKTQSLYVMTPMGVAKVGHVHAKCPQRRRLAWRLIRYLRAVASYADKELGGGYARAVAAYIRLGRRFGSLDAVRIGKRLAKAASVDVVDGELRVELDAEGERLDLAFKKEGPLTPQYRSKKEQGAAPPLEGMAILAKTPRRGLGTYPTLMKLMTLRDVYPVAERWLVGEAYQC